MSEKEKVEKKEEATKEEEKEEKKEEKQDKKASKKESKKEEKQEEQKPKEKLRKYKARNKRRFWWFVLFASMIAVSVFGFMNKEMGLGLVFLGFSLVGLCGLLFSPVRYIFTRKGVTIVYYFKIREEIEWWEVDKLSKGKSHYTIKYKRKKKYPFFVNSEILRTRRTKKLLQKLYVKEISKD